MKDIGCGAMVVFGYGYDVWQRVERRRNRMNVYKRISKDEHTSSNSTPSTTETVEEAPEDVHHDRPGCSEKPDRQPQDEDDESVDRGE